MNHATLHALISSCVLLAGCVSPRPTTTPTSGRLGYSCIPFSSESGIYVSQISPAEARKAPAWNPKKHLLPLLPRDADQIAWRKLDTMIADGRVPENAAFFQPGWEHERTKLVDLGDGIHWVYLVEFSAKIMNGLPPVVQILVTLDGKPVEPQLIYTRKP